MTEDVLYCSGITLTTERLVLKPLGTRYLKTTSKYAMDYENTKYMMFLPYESIGEVGIFLEKADEEWKKPDRDYLEFAVLLNGEHIGAVSVYFGDGTGELGWIIDRAYWGKGYAYEAVTALMRYCVNETDIKKFSAHCDTENTASYGLMEKLGMKRIGEYGGRRNRRSDKDSSEYHYELIINR